MTTDDLLIPKILPAYDDAVFKTLLTHPDAAPVLRDVVSSILMVPVDEVVVRNTELPIGDVGEKRERFDVNCRTSAGELVAMEMQSVPMHGDSAAYGHTNIRARSVYNLCDLHSSQPGRGVDYTDLMRTYQVVFCNYDVFPEHDSFVSRYTLKDGDGRELSDSISAVFVELTKLGPVIAKDAVDMTPLEAWSVFFAKAHEPECRKLITEIADIKKEVDMASSLLESISQDEIQQAHFRSRRIFERDMEHNYVAGRKEGLAEGLAKGRAELLKAAQGFKEKGIDPQIIADVTGLSPSEILSL
jgi:predicted transposase/invertase (TIGR01784 family)